MNLRRRLTPEERIEETKRIKLEEQAMAKRKSERPYIKFKGELHYYTEFIDIAMISDNLLEKAKSSNDLFVLGFDLEWPFSFQTGPGRTATIQIHSDEKSGYIFHVSQIKNLPKSLSELLIHPNVRLTGNCIKQDVRKLARDFKGFDSDKMVTNCIDLGTLANSILPLQKIWSLEKLVDYILDLRIDKNKKVRMSKWDIIPLSKDQQIYAATDSYASLLLYNALKKQQSEILD